ncbi:low molecular weight protein-tyrosine-phosphatase [Sphingomonas psychrotolerans]|uniref:protein-tyrosine-phosphatase n=1 Tax=Sphingomonas psychrotolerans TaxID=1327635 RepID=A0A2K8MJ52_9SPHN|nr:low molecular weight protein-tyrosine-phosphatase [Sphingomonas psychrotolerans]ATY33908.1 phosphotyrosine protein phosphatase [Sphingomonas psychrotolerans]
MRPPSLLFVCLGNICRSPLAEAAFRSAADRAGLVAVADSAATGEWQIGNPPDPRSQAVALRHGINISARRARRVRGADFTGFDYILALDPQNLFDLHAIAPGRCTARIELLMDQVPGCAGQAVRDPYYGDAADFDAVWEQVTRAADALVRVLKE